MAVAERTKSEAQRRQQILSAARDVFKGKGYESATISDIVRKAGVAQGTFYLYFDSKKSIIVELARQPMAEMSEKLVTVLSGDESFEDILRKFVRLGFEVGAENPDLCRLMHMGAENTDAIRDLELHSDVNQQAVGMFERFRASGQMVDMDPVVASEMFRIVVTGAMQLAFATEPRTSSLAEIVRATEIVVVRSFVTDPA